MPTSSSPRDGPRGVTLAETPDGVGVAGGLPDEADGWDEVGSDPRTMRATRSAEIDAPGQ